MKLITYALIIQFLTPKIYELVCQSLLHSIFSSPVGAYVIPWRTKPGACRHSSFATNPVLNYLEGKIKFFVQFHILVPNCSEGGYSFYFLKMKQI